MEDVMLLIGRKVIKGKLVRGWEMYLGFMFRKPSFPLVFFFPSYEERSFWSPFVFYPLEVIFLSPEGGVDKIAILPPWDVRGVKGRGKVVIEAPLGFSSRHGIKVGKKIRIKSAKGDVLF